MKLLFQIWRGETVLVSKLVSDQRKTLRQEQGDKNEKDEENAIDPSWGYGLSSRRKSSRYWGNRPGASTRRRMQEPTISTIAETEGGGDDNGDGSPHFSDEPKSARPGMPDRPLSSRCSHIEEAVHAASSNHFSKTESPSRPLEPSSIPGTVVISDETAPSRSLVVPLLELQEILADVNRGISSGRSVSHEDWEDLRELVTRLGGKFNNVVAFAWEQDVSRFHEEDENTL